ncbi:HSF-type DNA-binding-domain-containing protein [Paraphysoderma sedebokerense]|nr:HSF-type DNA-binding-domain-containing protein [Paraphysoderma sedebokerense]
MFSQLPEINHVVRSHTPVSRYTSPHLDNQLAHHSILVSSENVIGSEKISLMMPPSVNEIEISPTLSSASISASSSSSPSSSPNGARTSRISHSPYSSSNGHNFVHKLYRMLNDNECNSSIYWSECGTFFVVENISTFSKEILPQYFKHSNFASFLRQLNFYGFQKCHKSLRSCRLNSTESENRQFYHPFFLMDRPDMLCRIQRKSASDAAKPDTGDVAMVISMLEQQNNQLISRLRELETTLEYLTVNIQEQGLRLPSVETDNAEIYHY